MTSKKSDVVNYKEWLLRDYWTLDECCALICGVDPAFYREGLYLKNTHEQEGEIKRIRDIALRSIQVKKLVVYNQRTIFSKFGNTIEYRFDPKAFLTWADSKSFSLPNELQEVVKTISVAQEPLVTKNILGTSPTPNNKPETPPKEPHANKLRFSQQREDFIGCALSAVINFPDEFKKGKTITGAAIYAVLDENSLRFWPDAENGKPPLGHDKAIRLINSYLNRLREK